MDRYPRWGKVESVRLIEKTVHQTSGKAGKRETWPHGYRPFKRLENQARVPLRVVEFEKFRAGVTAALAIGFLFGVKRTACHLFMTGRRLDKQRLGTKHTATVVLVEHNTRSCHEHEGCQKDMSDPLQQILFFAKIIKKSDACTKIGGSERPINRLVARGQRGGKKESFFIHTKAF